MLAARCSPPRVKAGALSFPRRIAGSGAAQSVLHRLAEQDIIDAPKRRRFSRSEAEVSDARRWPRAGPMRVALCRTLAFRGAGCLAPRRPAAVAGSCLWLTRRQSRFGTATCFGVHRLLAVNIRSADRSWFENGSAWLYAALAAGDVFLEEVVDSVEVHIVELRVAWRPAASRSSWRRSNLSSALLQVRSTGVCGVSLGREDGGVVVV